MSYSFRLRFNTCDKVKFPFEERTIPILNSEKIKISLQSNHAECNIKDSTQLVLKGEGYTTSEEAQIAGEISRDQITLAFAKLRFPADFGDRAAKGHWTHYGLKMLEREVGTRVLNDLHGLQVYESAINPKFAKFSATAFITKSREVSFEVFEKAFSIEGSLNEKKRLAFELFSASSFTDYVDARFMLLMMALETLVEQNERPDEEQKLIDLLVETVSKSQIRNREALIGGLNNMRNESIGSAGRRLAINLKATYLNKSATAFFTLCYNLRSKLVHGLIPRPTFDEVGTVCGALETFVADIICYPEI